MNFLVLDINNKPLNIIAWDTGDILDVSNYARIVQYDGTYHPNWNWDNVNKVLIDPNPPEEIDLTVQPINVIT